MTYSIEIKTRRNEKHFIELNEVTFDVIHYEKIKPLLESLLGITYCASNSIVEFEYRLIKNTDIYNARLNEKYGDKLLKHDENIAVKNNDGTYNVSPLLKDDDPFVVIIKENIEKLLFWMIDSKRNANIDFIISIKS